MKELLLADAHQLSAPFMVNYRMYQQRMALIPAGEFEMGSNDNGNSWRKLFVCVRKMHKLNEF